jgi:hypothetical protein
MKAIRVTRSTGISGLVYEEEPDPTPVGGEVFGLTDPLRDGTAAEYVAVEARNLVPKPKTVDHVYARRCRGPGSRRGRACSITESWSRGRRWSSPARGRGRVDGGAACSLGQAASRERSSSSPDPELRRRSGRTGLVVTRSSRRLHSTDAS